MKADAMNSDPHERARLLIAMSGVERSDSEEFSNAELSCLDPSHSEQSWLAAHLESCQPCREFSVNSENTIRSLRGVPFAATGALVSRTQMRVRQRAEELQRQQERLWVVCACCAAVTLCTAVSTALLWRGFAWIGQQARFSAPVWESGFAVFYLTPAVLVGILLLARGTYLADHDRSFPD